MKFSKKEKGITLIVLIITIIIMVMIAGTVAFSVSSDDGIFSMKDKIEDDYNNNIEKTEEKVNSINSSWGTVLNHKGIDNELELSD